jgi:alpha-tubulin suppressor-like RCC1 family protein
LSFFQNNADEKYGKDSIAIIDAGDEHTVVVTNLGRVFTCGSNDFGQVLTSL